MKLGREALPKGDYPLGRRSRGSSKQLSDPSGCRSARQSEAKKNLRRGYPGTAGFYQAGIRPLARPSIFDRRTTSSDMRIEKAGRRGDASRGQVADPFFANFRRDLLFGVHGVQPRRKQADGKLVRSTGGLFTDINEQHRSFRSTLCSITWPDYTECPSLFVNVTVNELP